MPVSTTVRCHQRRLRGLLAGLSRLTSRFDLHEDGVVGFVDFAMLASDQLDEQI